MISIVDSYKSLRVKVSLMEYWDYMEQGSNKRTTEHAFGNMNGLGV